MEFELKTIDVRNLDLDPENPRFCHLVLAGRKLETQEELEEEIGKEKELVTLIKAVKKSGVKDPIWVKKKETGNYLVLEGNRRTVVLKQLIKENVTPPEGVKYDKVVANVIAPGTPKTEMLLQKARLQTGKKLWGAFNEAAVVYILRNEYMLEVEDIAVELQISMAEVRKREENYDLFNLYVSETGDKNPRMFSYFSEAPKKVKDWYGSNEEKLKKYFGLITPTKGIQKIRSASTRGGLRDFAKVLDVPEALDYLLTEKGATVEDALEIAKDIDLYKDKPFLKRISPIAMQLLTLDETQIEKLKNDVKLVNSIKQMRRACEHILKKIEQ